MSLELLPNEILFDIFDYLDGVDLLQAFCGLNSRLNFLLYKQYPIYRFNFNFLSKPTFNMICQQHLPSIADRVLILLFNNDDNFPGQINLFLSYMLPFNQFTHLRFLSFHSIRSYQTLMIIIDECYYLSNLTNLKFCSCNIQDMHADIQSLVNNIWSLPKLIYCTFDILIHNQMHFCMPQRVSSTMESLSILRKINQMQFKQLNGLFEHTPRLRCLSIVTESIYDENYIPSTFSTLTEFKIIIRDVSKMIIFLQSFPNLHRLDIEVHFALIDGYQWKKIICNHLPNLQVFRLKMVDRLVRDQNIEERVDELINSFRSPFWIDEHRWFVRCVTFGRTIHLCTLFKTSNYSGASFPDSLKSTDPADNQQVFCNTITSIYNPTFFDQVIPSDVRLCNIRDLHIKMPINNQFWSIVPSLNRLRSLTVFSYADIFQDQLQNLLDRTSNMRSICFYEHESLRSSQMSKFECKCASIRDLSLQHYGFGFRDYFDEIDCMKLVYSSLGIQCERLTIGVINRECIIYLVKNMKNLRTLNVDLKDNNDSQTLEVTKNNIELTQWLKERLPPTSLIVQNPDIVRTIQICIC